MASNSSRCSVCPPSNSSLADFCYLTYQWSRSKYDSKSGLFTYALPLWIVGVLGNLVNVAVFRHKNMVHPINSIFLWLSISDLLELAVLASNQWSCGWCGSIQMVNYVSLRNNISQCVLTLVTEYLFQVFHTITIGLNIVLAFCQYMVVAHPLTNQKNTFKNHFTKYAIIWMYILSFVLYLPFWYIHEIKKGFISSWVISLRRNHQYQDDWPMDPLVYVYILVCGIVLRIVPLIILITLCTLLLLAIRNAHRKRSDLGMKACQLSKAQRKVNRMNVTVAMVITMFLITEIPLGISSLSMFNTNSFFCSYFVNYLILLPVTLLNCCYSIFCYLIRIKEYRETLKLLLNRGRLVRQTDLESHPL